MSIVKALSNSLGSMFNIVYGAVAEKELQKATVRKEAGTLYLFTTGQKSVICNACTACVRCHLRIRTKSRPCP